MTLSKRAKSFINQNCRSQPNSKPGNLQTSLTDSEEDLPHSKEWEEWLSKYAGRSLEFGRGVFFESKRFSESCPVVYLSDVRRAFAIEIEPHKLMQLDGKILQSYPGNRFELFSDSYEKYIEQLAVRNWMLQDRFEFDSVAVTDFGFADALLEEFNLTRDNDSSDSTNRIWTDGEVTFFAKTDSFRSRLWLSFSLPPSSRRKSQVLEFVEPYLEYHIASRFRGTRRELFRKTLIDCADIAGPATESFEYFANLWLQKTVPNHKALPTSGDSKSRRVEKLKKLSNLNNECRYFATAGLIAEGIATDVSNIAKFAPLQATAIWPDKLWACKHLYLCMPYLQLDPISQFDDAVSWLEMHDFRFMPSGNFYPAGIKEN